MTDNGSTGTDSMGEAAQGASGTPQGGPATTGTQTPDEVTLLRSRAAGLDAKVSELTKAQKAADQRAAEALAKLADYEAGKVGADEALRAQVAAKDAEIERLRQEAMLAKVEARYPETFRELGDAASSLSEEKLAAIEARLTGVAPEPAYAAPPVPRGNNGSRVTSGVVTQPKEESSSDILAKLKTLPVPWS